MVALVIRVPVPHQKLQCMQGNQTESMQLQFPRYLYLLVKGRVCFPRQLSEVPYEPELFCPGLVIASIRMYFSSVGIYICRSIKT